MGFRSGDFEGWVGLLMSSSAWAAEVSLLTCPGAPSSTASISCPLSSTSPSTTSFSGPCSTWDTYFVENILVVAHFGLQPPDKNMYKHPANLASFLPIDRLLVCFLGFPLCLWHLVVIRLWAPCFRITIWVFSESILCLVPCSAGNYLCLSCIYLEAWWGLYTHLGAWGPVSLNLSVSMNWLLLCSMVWSQIGRSWADHLSHVWYDLVMC